MIIFVIHYLISILSLTAKLLTLSDTTTDETSLSNRPGNSSLKPTTPIESPSGNVVDMQGQILQVNNAGNVKKSFIVGLKNMEKRTFS